MDKCRNCGKNPRYIFNNLSLGEKGSRVKGIYVSLNSNQKLSVIATCDTQEPSLEVETIQINYCPMCGRKLNDAKT